MTQNVTVLGPNLFGADETFHVHAVGCGDIARKPLYRRHHERWDMEATSQRDVVESTYSDQIAEQEPGSDWAMWEAYESEFRFFPCVKLSRLDGEAS